MFVIHLFVWLAYGLIVGIIAKKLHQGDEPIGWLETIMVGVVGSYVGGLINWLLGWGVHVFEPSGMIMGIIGGVVFCYIYSYWKSKNNG